MLFRESVQPKNLVEMYLTLKLHADRVRTEWKKFHWLSESWVLVIKWG